MHYIADLPLEAVAHELEAPIGTVKSWLHRGRAAMAHDLVIDIEGSVKAPPAADVVDRARRRVRARAATVAAMLVLLVFGVLFLVRLLALRPDSVPVTPSPTPSTVDSSLRTVDWANATIDFLPRAYCPDGRITVQPTDTVRTSGPRDSWPKIGYLPDRVIVADVTRDGSDDAIIGANCARSADTDPNDVWLAVITRAGDGTLRQLAWIGGVNADLGFTVENGQIHVNGKQFEWDGTGFVAAS